MKAKHDALQEQVDNLAKQVAGLGSGTPAPIVAAPIPVPSGGEFDINQIAGMFASKQQLADLEARLNELDEFASNDLEPRVTELEKGVTMWNINLNEPVDAETDNEQAQNQSNFQNYVLNMNKIMNDRFKNIESFIDNMGNTNDAPTGEVDTASLMILINKNTAEIKNRATNADLEDLKK